MENRYPLFAGGRILKKEALWDLRDYAYDSVRLYYADYTTGILKGCEVRVEGMDLVIGRGLLKFGDVICLMREEERVPFRAENQIMVLKAVCEKRPEHPDYQIYQVNFFLEEEPALCKDQIELCRFHLREGSQLRDTYKDFADMGTEYDTLNLIHATVAGRTKDRLHPKILIQFARELHRCGRKEPADYSLIYQIENTMGELERPLLDTYLSDRLGEPMREQITNWNPDRIFEELEQILGKGSRSSGNGWKQNMIYVE